MGKLVVKQTLSHGQHFTAHLCQCKFDERQVAP